MSKVIALNNDGKPAYELWIDEAGLHLLNVEDSEETE